MKAGVYGYVATVAGITLWLTLTVPPAQHPRTDEPPCGNGLPVSRDDGTTDCCNRRNTKKCYSKGESR